MKNVFKIAWREFKAYFMSPIAYVCLITFLVLSSWIFFRGFFLIAQADLRLFFGMMPWIFLFFVPAVAMGKWSEEIKLGTIETLCTLPIRNGEIVVGKFLAGLGLISTALLLTLPVAISVSLIGDLDWGPVIGGYAGLVFLGGAYLAIGLAVSSITKNQIVAFIIGVTASFVLLIAGTSTITGGGRGVFAELMQYMGLGTHFSSIARGVIDSRDIIYYLSVIGFFLYVNLLFVRTRARR
jgi:gliding motility-associated transport system permease protein